MIRKKRLTESITEIETPYKEQIFRAFLVRTPTGNILVDSCLEDDDKSFASLASGLGLKMIVLTNHHRDHVGALEAVVQESPHIEVAAHREDADKMPVTVSVLLDDGDLIEDTLRVIHVPGHTAGSISLYHEDEKVLLTGDAVFGVGGYEKTLSFPPGIYSEDPQRARESVCNLLKYPFEKAFLSHGDHLEKDAYDRIKNLLNKEERPRK